MSSSLLEYFLFWPSYLNKAKLRKKLKGKTILITGASFGIGESLARILAPTGAKLLLVARTQSKLESLQKELQELGGIIEIYPLDLTQKEAVNSWLLSLPKDIDIIVSNAGKSIRRSIFKSLDRLHDFERTMALNYFAPVQILLDLIPKLEKTKGHIINISAVNVLLLPAPYWAAYQASKTAFDQWFRAVEPELRAKGIKTTSIYLPLVKTRMIAPTKIYQNTPAMQADHVAKIIAKSMYTQQAKYKPWWLMGAEIAALFFSKLWVFMTTLVLKKK